MATESDGLGITGREMCETIARAYRLASPDGPNLTPEEIWRYSPTGELFEILFWYMGALIILGEPILEPFRGWMDGIRRMHQ